MQAQTKSGLCLVSTNAFFRPGVALSDENLTLSLVRLAGGVLASLAINIILYLVLRYAQRRLMPSGEAGTVILLRQPAFILLCLAVKIVWDGASELRRGLLLSAGLP